MTFARSSFIASSRITDEAADDLVRLALADADGVVGLAEMIFSPGGGSCRSIRPAADEMIRVTSGHLSVWCGTERFELSAGDAVMVPHGTPRTIVNTGDVDARAMTVVVPVGVAIRPLRRRPATAFAARGTAAVHAAA